MSVAGVTVPAEGEAPAETPASEEVTKPDAVPAEGEAPPAEGEPPAAEPPKPAEIPEAELKAAALKFANRTMAAARRAESAVAVVKQENDALKAKVTQQDAFIADFRASPFNAIRKLGFSSVKDFIDAGIAAGEPREPTADDRVGALEKLIKERDEREAATRTAAAVEEARAKVFDALGKLPDRYDVAVGTKVGKAAVWEGIVEYNRLHGEVPDAAVFLIADGVERELANDVGTARKFKAAGPGATKQGTPATATAPDARSSGKTITNSSTSGAPTTREYSTDPDERRRQVNEDMRASGEL